MPTPVEDLVAAIHAEDAGKVRDAIQRHPELKERLNDPLPGLDFDATPLLSAVWKNNRDIIEVLLGAGADINARSRWWAGGFGPLDAGNPELAVFLIERGAVVDAHAAARLGMLDRLRALIDATPELVHARGGDGQTPLHFASTVEIASFLLDRGADIDARDVDHESTPAQYMIRDRQEIVRYLVSRGCRTDILMMAALGDLERVRQHLDRDPASIQTSVSEQYFPKQNPRAGGTIYMWTLGGNKTAHVIAREFGHADLFRFLMERTAPALKLAVACDIGDEALAREIARAVPNVVATLSSENRARLVDAAEGNRLAPVRLMLSIGWPVDVRGNLHATALHWASFHGNVEMVREILRHGMSPDVRGDDYNNTPLGWAIYGSVHGWNCRTGDFAGTVTALLDAGATVPPMKPDLDASDAVIAVLQERAKGRGHRV
jgi:ankyrin repeat protein